MAECKIRIKIPRGKVTLLEYFKQTVLKIHHKLLETLINTAYPATIQIPLVHYSLVTAEKNASFSLVTR